MCKEARPTQQRDALSLLKKSEKEEVQYKAENQQDQHNGWYKHNQSGQDHVKAVFLFQRGFFNVLLETLFRLFYIDLERIPSRHTVVNYPRRQAAAGTRLF